MAKFYMYDFGDSLFYRVPWAVRDDFRRLAPRAQVIVKEYNEAVTFRVNPRDAQDALGVLKYAEYEVKVKIR